MGPSARGLGQIGPSRLRMGWPYTGTALGPFDR